MQVGSLVRITDVHPLDAFFDGVFTYNNRFAEYVFIVKSLGKEHEDGYFTCRLQRLTGKERVYEFYKVGLEMAV